MFDVGFNVLIFISPLAFLKTKRLILWDHCVMRECACVRALLSKILN